MKKDNYDQIPMFVPPSDWRQPTTLPDLRDQPVISIDVETKDDALSNGRGAGWAYGAGYVAGVAVAWGGGAIYVPVQHPESECFPKNVVSHWLRRILGGNTDVVTHGGAYDWGWLIHDFGVSFPERLDDTIALSVMVDENRLSYKLDDVCKWRGIPGKDERVMSDAAAHYGIAPNKVKSNLWRLPARYVGPYAEQDGRATLALRNSLLPDVHSQHVWDAYHLEMQLVPVVYEMRRRGIRIDLDAAHEGERVLTAERDLALTELSSLAGRTLTMQHVRSTRHLEALHDEHQINYPRTAKTGQGSFTDEWMADHDHWLPRLVSKCQKLDSAASKFIRGYLIDYTHRGRLHASINQFRSEEGGTRSHRFSYSDPPLQQAPARDKEIARYFRACFLPEEGETWLSADYSQQEYRLIVHFAEMLGLPKAQAAADMYRTRPDTDFHQLVMDWTGLERKSAKNTNFAKAYGARIRKFALMIKQSEEDAQEIYDRYDDELPFVSALANKCQRLAETRGYVKLTDGAKCHFDMWEPASWDDRRGSYGARPLALAEAHWPGKRLRRAACHKAMNRLVQGSAARQTKLAIKLCHDAGHTPLLQMHDELCFSVGSGKAGKEIGEIMRTAAKMSIPNKVDLEYGASWGDAHHAWEDLS